jgi:hypothetical protein
MTLGVLDLMGQDPIHFCIALMPQLDGLVNMDDLGYTINTINNHNQGFKY